MQADEPESLSGRGDRLPVHPSAGWSEQAGVGKTLVSSSLIDRVVGAIGRRLVEVPVGFKWFVDGLLDGSIAFGGEESAGASFLTFDGKPWTTDKDGIILDLLASEILAVTGKTPSQRYRELADASANPLTRVSMRLRRGSRRRSWRSCRPTRSPRPNWPGRRSPRS